MPHREVARGGAPAQGLPDETDRVVLARGPEEVGQVLRSLRLERALGPAQAVDRDGMAVIVFRAAAVPDTAHEARVDAVRVVDGDVVVEATVEPLTGAAGGAALTLPYTVVAVPSDAVPPGDPELRLEVERRG